jgi:rhamnosyltransferase
MHIIAALVVTYNPDLQQVYKTVYSITKQVSYCIVIDNGNTIFNFQGIENIIIVNLGKNYGIAYAQNRGIELAQQHNADFIVLSDQDTIYPENYIERNIAAYQELKGHKLAALTPVFFNSRKKTKSPIMDKKFSSTTDFSRTYIKTAQAIASGTFIVAASLRDIGGMNEKLFIDYVDFEWCWKAAALGYEIYTISDLIINHDLGDDAKIVFGRQVTVRNDIRYYYMIRNGCYLARYSPFLTWHERFQLYKRVFIHIAGVMFLKRNIQCIRFIKSAVLAGLLDKMN